MYLFPIIIAMIGLGWFIERTKMKKDQKSKGMSKEEYNEALSKYGKAKRENEEKAKADIILKENRRKKAFILKENRRKEAFIFDRQKIKMLFTNAQIEGAKIRTKGIVRLDYRLYHAKNSVDLQEIIRTTMLYVTKWPKRINSLREELISYDNTGEWIKK